MSKRTGPVIASKRWFDDTDRSLSASSIQNRLLYSFAAGYDCKVVDTILNTADSTGGTHQIGELSTNTYTSADDVRDSQFWKILNYRKTFTFTNTDHHPVHLYLYEYISKKNRAFSETSLELLCAHDFEDAFDYESATGSNSATAVSGSAQMASASTAMNMVQHVPPHTLPAFRKKWKCSHKAQVVLQPGDTATYVLRAKKNIRFDYKDIISKDSSTYGGTIDDTLAVRGLGKVLMVARHDPQQEIQEAMKHRVHRNKKKYYRKTKHKNKTSD